MRPTVTSFHHGADRRGHSAIIKRSCCHRNPSRCGRVSRSTTGTNQSETSSCALQQTPVAATPEPERLQDLILRWQRYCPCAKRCGAEALQMPRGWTVLSHSDVVCPFVDTRDPRHSCRQRRKQWQKHRETSRNHNEEELLRGAVASCDRVTARIRSWISGSRVSPFSEG